MDQGHCARAQASATAQQATATLPRATPAERRRRWLERARAFAMHAAGQVERARTKYRHGHYSLWTGDLGTALYLADCVDGGGEPPLP